MTFIQEKTTHGWGDAVAHKQWSTVPERTTLSSICFFKSGRRSSTKMEIKRPCILDLELFVFGMFFFPSEYIVSFKLRGEGLKQKVLIRL